MSNSKTSAGGARAFPELSGLAAKASQDYKKDEFFSLVRRCAQLSTEKKTMVLRTRKYNGRTV
jgi:hypothetical protein